MKVNELRCLLDGVDGDLDVVVRTFGDDGDYVGTVGSVEVQFAHDDDATPFLAIDCGPDEDQDSDGGKEIEYVPIDLARRALRAAEWLATCDPDDVGADEVRGEIAELRKELGDG